MRTAMLALISVTLAPLSANAEWNERSSYDREFFSVIGIYDYIYPVSKQSYRDEVTEIEAENISTMSYNVEADVRSDVSFVDVRDGQISWLGRDGVVTTLALSPGAKICGSFEIRTSELASVIYASVPTDVCAIKGPLPLAGDTGLHFNEQF